jgi:tRNA nucleotidyltransferase (CCA-adding enzyme)
MTTKTLQSLVDELITGSMPHLALKAAREEGTLARLIPELDCLHGIPQSAEWHPEVDCFIHMLLVMEVAAQLTDRPRARFAALVHDFGKGLSPQESWPKHIEHERKGVPLVEAFGVRLGAPADWTKLGMLTSRWHLEVHKAFTLRAGTIIKLLTESGFIHDQEMFEDFLLACEADKRGRGGDYRNAEFRQRPFLLEAMEALRMVLGSVSARHDNQCYAIKAVLKRYI